MREINLAPYPPKNFGMVLQDNFLFRGSVRDNIIAGRPGLSVLKMPCVRRGWRGLRSLLSVLPNGYDTYHPGRFAEFIRWPKTAPGHCPRSWYHRPPKVLILDEATSRAGPGERGAGECEYTARIAKGQNHGDRLAPFIVIA